MYFGWLFPRKAKIAQNLVAIVKGDSVSEIENIDGFMCLDDFPKELQAMMDMFPCDVIPQTIRWMKGYNRDLDKFVSEYPILANRVWECYRRGLGLITAFSLDADRWGKILEEGEIQEELRPEEIEAMTHILNKKGARAQNYENQLRIIIPENDLFPLDQEPHYELKECEQDPLLGITSYTFINDKGKTIKTPWDRRSGEIPRFGLPIPNSNYDGWFNLDK